MEFEALLRAARNGDAAARDELLAALRERLCQWAEQKLRERNAVNFDASSIVQKSLLDVHLHLDDFQGVGEAQLLRWARSIVENDVNDAFRMAGAKKVDVSRTISIDMPLADDDSPAKCLPSREESPSCQLRRSETSEILQDAINELAPDQARAILLVHFDHLSVSEAAARMNRSRDAVAKLLQRGMAVLRQKLPKRIE